MYNNFTDSELLNVIPNTALEVELIKRLSGSTEQDWDDLRERAEELHTKARDSDEFAERLRDALRKVATEIYRCAYFGTVEITHEFKLVCQEVINSIDGVVAYDYPEQAKPINNSSSFRAGGDA